MRKRNSFLQYLPILISAILLCIHFLFFTRNEKCLALNEGLAFGLFSLQSQTLVNIISISSFALFLISALLSVKRIQKSLLFMIAFLSLGNIFDRVGDGVCDYIAISSLPVFNLLDLGIVIGICLIIADIIWEIWKE